MRLTWLAEALRAGGLTVVEVPGWETRGDELPGQCTVVIGHHTATSSSKRNAGSDLPTRRILVEGRPDLPGPLCQLALGRSGTYYVVASGKANHAGRGAWCGVSNSRRTLGIEAEHPGKGAWPPEQLAAFDRGVAVLLNHLGVGPDHYCGHREWATPTGRKVDPGGIDLDAQRLRVASLLSDGLQAGRRSALRGALPEEELDMDEATLRRIIQEEVREEIRTVLGNISGKDDPTHYGLNDVHRELNEIKAALRVPVG